MIIRRQTLEAILQAVQTKDDTHRLDRIEIRPDGSVTGTDGHVLLTGKEHARFPDEDFPQTAGAHYSGDATTPILIPTPEVKQLLKTAQTKGGKRGRTIPILGCVQVGMNGDGAFAAATDLQSSTTVRVHGPDKANGGPYPSWDKGIIPPKDRPALELCMSSEVLRALADAAEKAESSAKEAGGVVYLYIPTEKHYQGDRESDHAFDGDEQNGRGCSCGEDHTGWTQSNKHWHKVAGGNGQIVSAMRVEIRGREVKIEGAAMPCRMP